MVWLRTIAGKRGVLGAAVAVCFLLSTGILGFQLATSPPSAPSVDQGAPPDAPTPVAGHTGSAGSSGGDQAAPAGQWAAQLADQATQRLRQSGYQVTERDRAAGADCAADSYGQTKSYLAAHPCAGLQRLLFDVRGPGAARALVAVAWVRMPDPSGATGLKAVLDRSGSGNVNALDRSVVFSGQYYASRIDGTSAGNADVHPMGDGFSSAALNKIAAAALG
ncbi:MAG TPA: hypothetical protein VGH89_38205 [Pseudonocardia sp.]